MHNNRVSIPEKNASVFKEYTLLTLGALLIAIGVYFFKFPNHFSTGGVSAYPLF